MIVNMNRQVNRLLHDEHMHVQSLLERLRTLFLHDDADRLGMAEGIALLRQLTPVLSGDLQRHFKLEEDDLFPTLEEQGDGDIVALLTEDHEILLPLAGQVLALARQAQDAEFDAVAWQSFRRLGLEFVERQIDHIEKEEMALLPLLEEAIDYDTDQRIWTAYAAT